MRTSNPPTSPGFLAEQLRIIGALIMREIYTRFGRDNLGFAWLIAEPIMFCSGVIVLWSLARNQQHSDLQIVPFLITGYMPLLMYRHAIMRLMRCMQANSSLLYHRPVTIFSMYIARLTIEIVGVMAGFITSMIVFGIFGYVKWPHDIPLMLAGWCLYILYTCAFSMALGALSERSELVDKFWQPIGYITIPTTGTFYMLNWMPQGIREILLWSPQVSAVEMIRGGYFGPDNPTYYAPEYAAKVSIVLLMIALFFLKDVRRHVEIE